MPSSRSLEALDASLPLLTRADAEFPSQACPGESLDAYRQRRLPPRIWTLLVAVKADLPRKDRVKSPPQQTATD